MVLSEPVLWDARAWDKVIPNGMSRPLKIVLKFGAHTSVVQLLLRSNPTLAQRILGTDVDNIDNIEKA